MNYPPHTHLRYLKELGAEYESRDMDMANKEHKSEWYLAVNPFGKLPALQDGDVTLVLVVVHNHCVLVVYLFCSCCAPVVHNRCVPMHGHKDGYEPGWFSFPFVSFVYTCTTTHMHNNTHAPPYHTTPYSPCTV